MTCSVDTAPTVIAPESLVAALAEGGLPECCEVEAMGDRAWVLFPESDFAVHAEEGSTEQTLRFVITASVRAPAPSLETWWEERSLEVSRRDPAAAVLAEVLVVRDRYLRMLADRDSVSPAGT